MDSSSNPNPYSYSLPGKALKLDSKDDIQPYLDEINKLEKLQEIHVGGHTLGVEACKALADVLREKKELQVADFSDIFTGRLITEIPLALSALCDSLVDHKELVEINLSDNAFGGRSAEPMVNFLTHNHSFSILKLSNNGLGISGGKIVAGALLSAAQELKEKNLTSNLTTIICGRNRLEDGSSDAWRQAFEAHGSLKEVRMYQNGIRMTGFENICKGLSECTGLEIFDMQDNTATYRGAVAIAEAMKNWSNLKELNLNECIIRAKGAPLVFEQLQHTPLLERFGLEYNGLKKEQIDFLAGQVSSHLKNLTHLNVKANPTDEEDESIEKLREAMTKWGNEEGLEAEEMEDPEDEEDEDEDEDEEEEEEAEDIDSSSKEDQVEDSLAPALAATSISSPTPASSEPAKSISSTPITNGTSDSTLGTSASTPSDSIIEDQDPTTSKAIETNGTTIATFSNDSELSSNQPTTPSDASPDVDEEDLGAVEATPVVGGAALGATAALGALSLSDPPSSEDKQVESQVSTSISAADTQESDLALETLPQSKIYTLPGKGLKLNTREDFAPYAKEIEAIQDLEEIHVGGHTLGVGACQALADVLREKQSLKVADFADIFTGRLITEIPLALSALCDSLVDHKELVEINLSDNAFGGRSAEPMVNFLTHNHSFSILKLSNNGLGVSGGKIVAGALLSAAQELKEKNLTSNLTTIICGRNRLEDGSSDAWRQAFEAHGSLKEVRMYQNGIRMTGFENICKGLSECKGLEIFDMQDNTATYRGAVAIAEAMKNWSNLKELNLNECIIRAKGAPLVLEQLQHTPLLEKFGLEYNGLKKEQIDILAGQVSSHLKNLTHLNVKANPTDEEDESIEKLREAMTKWGNEAGLEAEEMEDPEDEEDEDEDEEEEEEDEGDDVEEEKSEEANTSNNDDAPNENSATKDAKVTGAAVGAGAILAGSGTALLDSEKSSEINNHSRSIESEDQAPHSSQDPSPIPQAESVPQETAAIDSHADSLASETHPSIPENSTNTSVKEDVESASEKEEAVKSTELEQTINKQKDVLEKDQPLENAQPASAIGVLDSDKEVLTGQESDDHLQELEQEASQIKSSETNVSESDQAQAEEEVKDQQEKEEAIKTTELEQVINKEKDSEEKNVPLEDAEPATAVGVLDSDAEVIQGKEPVDHVKELEQEATAAQGSSSTKETNDVSDSQDESQSQSTPQPTITETMESVGVAGVAGVAAVASSVAGAAFGSSKVKDETSREAPTSDSEKLQDAASSEKMVSADNKADSVQEIHSEEPVHQEAPQQEQVGKTKAEEDANSAAATEQVESQEPQSESTPPNPTILESAQSLAVAGGAGIASLAASTSAAVSDLVSSTSDKSKKVTEVEQSETVGFEEPSASNDTGKSRAIEPSPSSSVINEAIERSNEIPTVDDPETLQKEQKKSKKKLFAPFTAAWEMLFSKAP